jgi:hypothetical protein
MSALAIRHNFTRQYCVFGMLHVGVASLGHIFNIHLSHIIPHKLALSETRTSVQAVHRPSLLQSL